MMINDETIVPRAITAAKTFMKGKKRRLRTKVSENMCKVISIIIYGYTKYIY